MDLDRDVPDESRGYSSVGVWVSQGHEQYLACIR